MATDDPDRHRETPLGDWTVPDLMTAFAGPNEGATGKPQQSPQLTIKAGGHSRRGYHRHGLHALRDNMQLYLVAGRCKPVFGCDLGSDFKHPGDEQFEGRGFRGQGQLIIGAPPHTGVTVPFRADLETSSW
jgi:hypothetical protein